MLRIVLEHLSQRFDIPNVVGTELKFNKVSAFHEKSMRGVAELVKAILLGRSAKWWYHRGKEGFPDGKARLSAVARTIFIFP
jgi:hypothetical protein